MNNIDDIFKNSEHEKELNIRPELWDRLQRRLDHIDLPQRPKWRMWMVAASWVAILTMSTLLYLNIETYEVQDMKVVIKPHFSKEEIAGLERAWDIPQSLFVHPSYRYLSPPDLKG